MLESRFQADLINILEDMFEGCVILKNDANYIQGFPDLLILYRNKWAALECKRSPYASAQPNQEYYVDMLDKMSFSRFVYPENLKEVLDALQRSFSPGRTACLSRRQ